MRRRLVEIGGSVAQDFGMGRVVGQVLTELYLRDGPCSLDELVSDLGLSKAAVSIATRRLEALGLVRRAWRPGDRRLYYRTADNIAVALRQGFLAQARWGTNSTRPRLCWRVATTKASRSCERASCGPARSRNAWSVCWRVRCSNCWPSDRARAWVCGAHN